MECKYSKSRNKDEAVVKVNVLEYCHHFGSCLTVAVLLISYFGSTRAFFFSLISLQWKN